jgi:hypothetical protein
VKKLVIRPAAIADMDREAFRIAEYSGQDSDMRFYAACDETLMEGLKQSERDPIPRL